MKQLEGIVPIVAAVFDDRGRVDHEGFARLVSHLMGTGARGLVLFGLATEFHKLTDAEKDVMTKTLLSATTASDRVAGVVSITDHSLETAIERARRAEEQGADAIMLLPPFFLSPSQDAILEHMRRVAQAVSIPVIVQYAPAQTGIKLPPDVFVRLVDECPNARFVKVETQPPGPYATALHVQSGGRIATLVGCAGVQMMDVLARGSIGIQPGCSFTEVYVEIYRLYKEGRTLEAQELFGRLLPYVSYWMQGVELIIRAEKRILKRRGIIASDYCRHPSYTLDEKEEALIERFLDEFSGLL